MAGYVMGPVQPPGAVPALVGELVDLWVDLWVGLVAMEGLVPLRVLEARPWEVQSMMVVGAPVAPAALTVLTVEAVAPPLLHGRAQLLEKT